MVGTRVCTRLHFLAWSYRNRVLFPSPIMGGERRYSPEVLPLLSFHPSSASFLLPVTLSHTKCRMNSKFKHCLTHSIFSWAFFVVLCSSLGLWRLFESFFLNARIHCQSQRGIAKGTGEMPSSFPSAVANLLKLKLFLFAGQKALKKWLTRKSHTLSVVEM